jgi:hypothetical protein
MTTDHLDYNEVVPQSAGVSWPKPISSLSIDLIYELGKNPSDQLVYEMLSKDKWAAALGFLDQYEEKLCAKLDKVAELKLKLKELCDV